MKTNNREAEAAKHTPGPWTASSFDGVHQYAEVTAGDGIKDLVRICDIPSWPCATEEAEANARLIAASPELAAMLATALDRIESANARFEAVGKIGYRTDDISTVLAKALSA